MSENLNAKGLPPEPVHPDLDPRLIVRANERFVKAASTVMHAFNPKNVEAFAATKEVILNKKTIRKPMNAFLAKHIPADADTQQERLDHKAIKAGLTIGFRIGEDIHTFFDAKRRHQTYVQQYLHDLSVSAEQSVYGLRDTLTRGQEQDPFRRAAVEMIPGVSQKIYPNSGEQRQLFIAALGFAAQVGLVALVEDAMYVTASRVRVPLAEQEHMQKDLVASIAEQGVHPDGWPAPQHRHAA